MNEAQRVAEKHLPKVEWSLRGPNYAPSDLNANPRMACVAAIQEFAQAVAEKIRADAKNGDFWLNNELEEAAQMIEREAGIEEKNG